MTSGQASASNPFSTRFVRPGALEFQFASGVSIDVVLARLEANKHWGEIVGLHGSGKSTLLARLAAALEATGVSIVQITLHDGQRRLPRGVLPRTTSPHDEKQPHTIMLVDGYEQLGRWQRVSLMRHCRRTQYGLVVTTHESVGLPALFATATDVAMAIELARRLQHDRLEPVTAADVAEAFAARRGDLREIFFDLYDRYERAQRAAASQKA